MTGPENGGPKIVDGLEWELRRGIWRMRRQAAPEPARVRKLPARSQQQAPARPALALTGPAAGRDPRAWVRVADGIRDLISSGALGPGAKVPPLPELSRASGYSPGTCAKARRALADEGVLERGPGRGYVVARSREQTAHNEEAVPVTAIVQQSFAEMFDYYQAAVYPGRQVLAESIAALIASTGSRRVLDCACGTGLAGVDLRSLGVELTCTDADPAMLGRFGVNALAAGVDPVAHLASWSALGALARPHEYVLCRGNSLAYADAWHDQVPAAGTRALGTHLRAITAIVAPGGWLHIDAPRTCLPSSADYPEVTFRGSRVRVSEQITVLDGCRRWDQQVTVDGTEHRFTRYSALLTGDALAVMLTRTGFSVETVRLPGERDAYHVLLARKPG
jgi:DNA-binding transcriptional regulator YhcF (GntR family)